MKTPAEKDPQYPDNDPLLTNKEASRLLKVTIRTLDRWRCNGSITAAEKGGRIHFTKEEVERVRNGKKK